MKKLSQPLGLDGETNPCYTSRRSRSYACTRVSAPRRGRLGPSVASRFRVRWGLLALFIACAPARQRALAQFAPPYDPDFPSEATPAVPSGKGEQPPPGEPTAAQPVRVSTAGGPFLLLDRQDPSQVFERPSPPRAPTPEFDEFRKGLKPFRFSQEKWNKARSNLDLDLAPQEGVVETAPAAEGVAAVSTTAFHRPPPPEVELATYGTSLSVTGRKVINLNYSEKRFFYPQKTTSRPETTGFFDIQQQLQLRMQGQVGPKIKINVDYDDTKPNKQDISIVYAGDPNEVVQNVSFGDIDLSLPATEFVSYNKQLFGIRGDVRYKGIKASVIASRTKGQTKVRQFYGNTQFVTADILDTSYLRRQHYDVSFSSSTRLPIRAGSERIFLALQTPGQQINLGDVDLTVDDLAVQGSTFTGRFSRLVPGVDYTLDYSKGILTFRNRLEAQHVAAVDFTDANGISITVQSTFSAAGGSGRLKLIKTVADVPLVISSETGHNRELKTFYSIGQNNIVRDNGRGNFILRVLDPVKRAEVGSSLIPRQVYPEDMEVDFENGVFRLLSPFSISNSSPTTPDPELYAPTPISKRLFRLEYHFRFKTFFLEPSLVPQSEVVVLDRQRLSRNVDYFIDYDAGFITFFNEDRIRPDSELSIAYEVAPFLGISNESLLGTRVAYPLGKHVTMGSTLLYQAGVRSPSVPSITELARSLLTYEFDTQIKSVKVFDWLTANLSGEFAQSRQNLNLNAFALIDNMEGIKQEDSAPTIAAAWRFSSNPGGAPTDPSKFKSFTNDVKTLEINPRADAGPEELTRVLGFEYDFANAASQEASIVFPFSVSGEDFSQKNILEVVMLGDNSLNEINFHLGGVNEDADGDGVLDTEDVNGDGILNEGEDVGTLYNPAGLPSTRFGIGNGTIDTEDLNNNSRLDGADFTGDDFGYIGAAATGNNILFNATDSSNHTFVNFGGAKWRTFQIPLQISTGTASRWTAIKQIRISVRKRAAGFVGPSSLQFARIAVVGNTWLRGQAGDPSTGQGKIGAESLTVTPVNSVDNPDYTPIFNAGGEATEVFSDLYGDLATLRRQSGSRNLTEQALQLEFVELAAGAVVTTRRLLGRAVDVSQHRFFNFLVFGNADPNNINVSGNKTFFLRAGNDVNFFEVRVPLNFTGWRKIALKQEDLNGDSIGDVWRAQTPGTVVVTSGTPTLQQVSQIVAGVKSSASPPGETRRGRVFLNEIYLSDPVVRVGTAKKLEASFDIPGWVSFGGKHRSVDRNFQTPTSVVSNQDRREDSGFLNFTRVRFMPLTFNLSRAITLTPSTVQTGDLSNIVNILQQGKVTTWNGSASGNFSYGALPRLNFGHTRHRIDYDLLTRLDDRQGYNAGLTYGVPLQWRILPRTIDLNYNHSRYEVSFESLAARKIAGNFNTRERSQGAGLRLTFVPWEGAGINPNYTLTRVIERRADFTSPNEVTKAYPKSLNQGLAVNSNFRLLSWLNPQMSYSVDTIENNILNVSTFVVFGSTFVFDVGDIKTVNRNANGSLNLPISVGDIVGWRLLRSMHIASGYQLQDGDVWNNVEKGLRSHLKLWVRESLKPANPAARRANQTLRDTYNSSQRWSPIEGFDIGGRWGAFKTLALSNNYVKTITRTNVTGTVSKTISETLPDAVASISQLEKLFFSERWMANTQMNFKYSAHRTETVDTSVDEDEAFGTDLRTIIRKKFDTLINYNFRTAEKQDLRVKQVTERASHEDATVQVTFDIRKFRFTPKVDYSNDIKRLGTGVKTQDLTVITPSLLVRADLAMPKGLKLPGASRPLLFTNRIIWTTTMSLANKFSSITQADNSRLFSLNTSGDYEIAKNLRMTMNGAVSRLWHKFQKEEEFVSYQVGSTLTFQF